VSVGLAKKQNDDGKNFLFGEGKTFSILYYYERESKEKRTKSSADGMEWVSAAFIITFLFTGFVPSLEKRASIVGDKEVKSREMLNS
jgi:hypothetical protein